MLETMRLKVALTLARRGRLVVGALLALAVVSGAAAGVAYATHDDTYTVTEQTHVQRVGLTATDSAVVTNETMLWDTGTRLSDHPAYLTDVSPTLTVASTTTLPEGTAVEVQTRTVLVVVASVDDEQFWADNRTLGTESATVSDGRFVASSSVALPPLADRLQRVRAAAGDATTLTARLRIEVEYASDRYEGSLVTSAPLTVGGSTYQVGSFDPATRTHHQTVTHTRREPGLTPPDLTVAGGAVSLVSLVAAAGAVVGTRRYDDPARFRKELERTRLAEWISTGSVPPAYGETTVTMSSLTDLVDVAIDTDKRVVHDTDRDVYVVLHDDVAFIYED